MAYTCPIAPSNSLHSSHLSKVPNSPFLRFNEYRPTTIYSFYTPVQFFLTTAQLTSKHLILARERYCYSAWLFASPDSLQTALTGSAVSAQASGQKPHAHAHTRIPYTQVLRMGSTQTFTQTQCVHTRTHAHRRTQDGPVLFCLPWSRARGAQVQSKPPYCALHTHISLVTHTEGPRQSTIREGAAPRTRSLLARSEAALFLGVRL